MSHQQRPSVLRDRLEMYAPGFRAHLAGAGYVPTSVRHRLMQFAALGRWMETEDVAPCELTEVHARDFTAARRDKGLSTWVSPESVALPLKYLRSIGIVPERVDAVIEDPIGQLIDSYRIYLIAERGVAADTLHAYLRVARAFCDHAEGNRRDLSTLSGAEVMEFAVVTCGRSSTASAKKTVTALASLLRYLHIVGATATPLASALPKVRGRGSRTVSPGVQPDQVVRLLSSCDRRTSVGRRDYAILMLLSRLGMRAAEVAALTLDDFDWHHGEVLVRGKGNSHERLPLPPDVGEAVASYLRRGRRAPETCRSLFLRVAAPRGAASPSVIRQVVSRAARRASLSEFGSHALRHYAATQLLRNGVSLSGVSQVLRHHSSQVTARYAAVEPAALRELAKPWPGSGR